MKRVLPPLIPMLIAIAASEIAVRQGWIAAYLVPAPSAVLMATLGWQPTPKRVVQAPVPQVPAAVTPASEPAIAMRLDWSP